MKVSLSSTAEYSSKAAESIKDLNPNAADVMTVSYTHLRAHRDKRQSRMPSSA